MIKVEYYAGEVKYFTEREWEEECTRVKTLRKRLKEQTPFISLSPIRLVARPMPD